MKNHGFMPFLILLFFFNIHSYSQVTKISDTSQEAELPFIKVLQNGNILIIYSEGKSFNGDATLYYHIYDQNTKIWSNPTMAVNKYFSSAYAQLAEDSDGNLHMAYHDGGSSKNREIYYTTYNITSDKWGPRHLVYQSAGLNSTWPRIQVKEEKIFIAWSHSYTGDPEMDITMVENVIGGTWPVPKLERKTISDSPLSTSIHCDFSYRDGKIYCLWMDDGHHLKHWNMYYNEGTFNENKKDWEWETPTRLFPENAMQYYPGLTLDDEGNVHIVYSHKQNPIWHAYKTGNTWSQPQEISTGSTTQNMFMVLRFSHGLLHTVWSQGTSVFYGRGLPDGTWATPVKIADGISPGYPGLDVDNAGDAHVIWTDDDKEIPRNVYYTKVELPGTEPTAVIKATPLMGIIPLTVKFNASKSSDKEGKIIDYRWNFGDGTKAAGKKVSHTYNEKGTYIATLTVIDEELRTGTAQVKITATTGEPLPVIKVSATEGISPLTITFDGSDSSDPDGTIVSYLWEFGDGSSDQGVSVTHTYTSGGRYTARLTVTDNDGKTSTATQEIIVYEKPVASFTVDPVLGRVPLEVSFDASSSHDPDGSIESFKWDFGDGSTASVQQVIHTFITPGTFQVVLTVVDNDNISDEAAHEIRALDKPLAPVNIEVETIINKSFLYTDYLNRINWTENPENEGLFNITHYRIYRKSQGETDAQFALVSEVSSGIFTYDNRGLASSQESAHYEYAVTAVDDEGNESLFGLVAGSLASRR